VLHAGCQWAGVLADALAELLAGRPHHLPACAVGNYQAQADAPSDPFPYVPMLADEGTHKQHDFALPMLVGEGTRTLMLADEKTHMSQIVAFLVLGESGDHVATKSLPGMDREHLELMSVCEGLQEPSLQRSCDLLDSARHLSVIRVKLPANMNFPSQTMRSQAPRASGQLLETQDVEVLMADGSQRKVDGSSLTEDGLGALWLQQLRATPRRVRRPEQMYGNLHHQDLPQPSLRRACPNAFHQCQAHGRSAAFLNV
jgi:hypothetical protein